MTDRNIRAAWMSEKFWRKTRLAHSFALLGVVAMAATGTFAVEESASLIGPGLSGIFPSSVPDDLGDDQFSKLDGNWAEWSKTASAAVTEFYSKLEGSDSAAQRKALSALKVKQDVMRRALDDSRYASLHGPLAALYNSLTLRIEFAEAALDTLEMNGKQIAAAKTKTRANSVLSSIQALENYLGTVGNGNLWIPYFHVNEVKSALTADSESADAITAATNAQISLKNRDTTLDASQKTFAHHSTFDAYSNAIDEFLAVAPWSNPEEATKKLRSELKTLATALDTYRSSGEKANELRDAFARVRYLSADGGDRLATALQKRLFNYNLRFLVTENFLNRLMSQSKAEQGPVVDFVLGANVSGNQITYTTVNVDLKPSDNTARFDLRLNGNINSSTAGVTPQATVWTQGNHTFTASKEVNFDGFNFSTLPATIAVNPHNTTTGISTKVSGIPILGRIANRIASEQVEEKRGQAEAIAASRVQDGVLPRFNQEVDRSFAEQGYKLNNEVFSGLRATGLFPDTFNYQTTDQLLTMNARVMSPHQIAGAIPESRYLSTTGATGLIHETAINNAIDQIGLAGQTLTEEQLKAKVEEFISKATNKPFKFAAPPPVQPAEEQGEDEKRLNAIIFAPVDPIRVRIVDNELRIVIRAGFKQEGREDIPTQEITVPISMEVSGKQIAAKAGNVVVQSATDEEGGGVGVRAVVKRKIQSLLPDRVLDGKVEMKTPEKIVVAYITKLQMADGWVSVGID